MPDCAWLRRVPAPGLGAWLFLLLSACTTVGPDPEPELQPVFEPDVKEASSEGQQNILHFRTADDLRIDLIAAEPFLANPVAFDIAPNGDFYVAETFRIHQGVTDMRRHSSWLEDDLSNRTVEDRLATMRRNLGEAFDSYRGATDRIKLLQDSDGDGHLDRHIVFADGFSGYLSGIGSGVLVQGQDVYYSNIPDLWKLKDEDGDGRADSRQSLSTGYGIRFGFYGHDLHGLIRGPDGRIYFSIGDRGLHVKTPRGVLSYPDEGVVLRCNPDGSELEVVHRGLRNPQELAFDDYGNLFTGDNNSDGGDLARWVQVVEGGDSGWRVGYQYLGQPIPRGPWNLERLWLPQFEGQASYIVPPVANIGDGPAGLAYYPGTGLPDEYRAHFFLCDFRGSPASLIHSFRLRPRGATFELVDRRDFATGALFTDVDFGPAAGLYFSDWVRGWGLTGKGRIYRIYDDHAEGNSAAESTGPLLRQDFSRMADAELVDLMAHPDQRIRLRAQFTLAGRGGRSADLLRAVAIGGEARLARIHAIWGLGQLGRQQVAVSADLIPLVGDPDEEVRAQSVRVLGDLLASSAVGALTKALADESLRVRSLAALSLGATASPRAVAPLLQMIRETGLDDAYLRHGAVMGLSGCASPGDLERLTDDPSAAVRLSAVLALRRLTEPGVARFLDDPEPQVVTEAARAIYDVPIESALPRLASLLNQDRYARLAPAGRLSRETLTAYRDLAVLDADDGSLRFTLPLLLRAVNASWRVGGAQQVQALARVAADRSAHWLVRLEAVRRLEQWNVDARLDPMLGVYRPFSAHPTELPRRAALALHEQLLRSERDDLLTAAISLVGHYGIREAASTLARLAAQESRSEQIRQTALGSLTEIGGDDARRAVLASLDSSSPRLRGFALRMLARLDPAAVAPRIERTLQQGEAFEKQAALSLLSELGTPVAWALLLKLIDQLEEKSLDPAIELDVLEAATASPVEEHRARAARFRESAKVWDELGLYRTALQGGDPRIGRALFLFNSSADCKRCHGMDGFDGEMIGPDLTDVASRLSRKEILEAIVYPSRTIAAGYETVDITLKDGRHFSGRILREDDETLVLEEDLSFYEFDSEDGRLPHSEVDAIAGAAPDRPTEKIVLHRGDIRSRRASQSGMPEDVVEALSLSQLRDLVAFLASAPD